MRSTASSFAGMGRASLARLDGLLDSPGVKAGGLLALLTAWFLAVASSPDLPFPGCSPGWWGHWDQGRYLACAQALARGELSPQTYWYPLGYPALGALFAGLSPGHPFLPVDAACVALSGALFWRIARRFLPPWQAWLLLALCPLLLGAEARASLAKPWNTLPTMALAYWLVLEQFSPRAGRGRAALRFLAVGCAWLVRPSDALFLLPLPLLAAFRGRTPAQGLAAALPGAALFALFPLGVAALNLAVFGEATTPYEANTRAIGFFSWPLAAKAYAVFVDALPVYGLPGVAFLERMPWLLLAPLGAWAAWRREPGATRAAALSVCLCLLLYLAYNDFTPFNIYAFELVHYVFWTLPLLLLCAFLALASGAALRPSALAALALAVAALAVAAPREEQAFQGRVDPSGGFAPSRGSLSARVDLLELGAPLPATHAGPVLAEGAEPLRPFRDFLSWSGASGSRVLLSSGRPAGGLRLLPEGVRGGGVTGVAVRWGLRGPRELALLALRHGSGSGPLGRRPVVTATPAPGGGTEVVARVDGPGALLGAVPGWFVVVEGAGGFAGGEVAAPDALPLEVALERGGGALARLTLTARTQRTLPPGAAVTVSPLDGRGRALRIWPARPGDDG